ncbi:amino acid ABC transporter permease [Arthrobacter sp. 2MCAF14]|uniref:amino acid ABC transporter permease n=1 Tax=Arthrobacter sp. 2MCAF14 TaxID=3232982 RepID=UPI003F8ECA3D
MTLFFGDLIPFIPQFLRGIGISLYVTIIAMFAGGVVSVFLYLGKSGRTRWLAVFCSVYIEVFRNTPLLVQLYLIYFGLPQLGIDLDPIWAAIIGLTLNNAAYTAEIYRAGFEAIPRGLREAASALGLRGGDTIRYVLLKPASRNVFPALTNQFILLFLASSVGSIISLPELTDAMLGASNATFRVFESLSVGGVLYFTASGLLALGSRIFEARLFVWAAK